MRIIITEGLLFLGRLVSKFMFEMSQKEQKEVKWKVWSNDVFLFFVCFCCHRGG